MLDNTLIEALDYGQNAGTQSAGGKWVITYDFRNFGQYIDSGGQHTSVEWTPTEIKSIQNALSVYESLTNIDFQVYNPEVHTAPEPNFTFLKGPLNKGEGQMMMPYGSRQIAVFDPSMREWSETEEIGPGSFPFLVMLHEIGHGLGLDHPFMPVDGGAPFPGVVPILNEDGEIVSYDRGDHDLNDQRNTIMSNNEIGSGTYPSTPMALDIATLHKKYGTPTDLRTGDTIYEVKGAILETIVDCGGADTLKVTGDSDAVLDLRSATLDVNTNGGGFRSHIVGSNGGVLIAYGTVIERAVGGGGNDHITGNSHNNEFIGNGGNDFIDGDAGVDTALYDNAQSNISVRFGISPDVTEFFDIYVNDGQGGEDTLRRIEAISGTQHDDTVILDDRTLGILSTFNDIHIEIDLKESNDRRDNDLVDLSQLRGEYIFAFNASTATLTIGGTTLVVKGADKYLDGGKGITFQMGYLLEVDGGLGADTIIASAQAEIMRGGSDAQEILVASSGEFWPLATQESVDTISFELSTAAVHVDLNTNFVSGGFADGDEISGFENVKGSRFNDQIFGGDFTTEIIAGEGDDVIKSGIGDTRIDGGIGDDKVIAGIGIERIFDSDFMTIDYSGATDVGIRIRTALVDVGTRTSTYLVGYQGIAQGDQFDGKYLTLIGTAFDDDITTRAYSGGNWTNNPVFADETIYAGGGNDTIDARNGRNIVFGEGGNDIIKTAEGVDHIDGGAGDDRIMAGAGSDTIYGGSGFDWINPGMDTDVDIVDFGESGGGLSFEGETTRVFVNIQDRTWHSLIYNKGGNDIFNGSFGDVVGSTGADVIYGSSGDDRIYGGGGWDEIYGEAGDDYIVLSGKWISADIGYAYGGDGNDTIYGGEGKLHLAGGDGNDWLHAKGPNGEGVIGGAATLEGGAGTDHMIGRSNGSIFVTLNDGDVITAYGEANTLSFANANAVTFDRYGTSNGIETTGYFRTVIGSDYGDSLTALHKKLDVVYGGGGDDLIYFKQSNGNMATAYGGSGSDTFVLGLGDDQVYMDDGHDLLDTRLNKGYEYIRGFSEGDRIIVSSKFLFNSDGTLMTADEFIDKHTVFHDSGGATMSWGMGQLGLFGVAKSDIGANDFIFI